MDGVDGFNPRNQERGDGPTARRQEGSVTNGLPSAGFRRDLEFLRNRLGHAIVYDAALRGYRQPPRSASETAAPSPGPCFTPGELSSLLALMEVIRPGDPGLVDRVVETVLLRTIRPLGRELDPVAEMSRRTRVLAPGSYPVSPADFQAVTRGLVERRRLTINYPARGEGRAIERTVSPQRLIRCGDRWLLDAWCHDRNRLEMLALNTMESVSLLRIVAHEVPLDELERLSESRDGVVTADQRRDATRSGSLP